MKKNEAEVQTHVRKSPFYSIIEGKVISITNPDDKLHVTSPCKTTPCNANIQILSIVSNGQNYHGQFHAKDTLNIYFSFTLSPTEEIFPELNQHLPGLNVGDIFTAQLYESPDANPPYRIKVYEVKH